MKLPLLVILISTTSLAMQPAAPNQNQQDGYDTDPYSLEDDINNPTDMTFLLNFFEQEEESKPAPKANKSAPQ